MQLADIIFHGEKTHLQYVYVHFTGTVQEIMAGEAHLHTVLKAAT